MAFKITLQPDVETFTVDGSESVLDAALRLGQRLPYGCRGGTCGSCRAKLIQGDIDYPNGEPMALSVAEQAAGQILLCQAYPGSDLEIEIHTDERTGEIVVKTLPCRVMNMQTLAADVMQLDLKLPASERLQYLAGQYIDIMLRDGRRRSFSLANPPHDDEFLQLHVRHVPGGEFTSFVFEGMKEKAILRLQGPLGAFYLREDSQRPMIMMAGGTGFAPIKAMLEYSFYRNFTRPIHFYWGVRAARDLYQQSLPKHWATRYSHFHYTPVLSEPLPQDQWSGRTGWVHTAVAEDYPDLSEYQVYMSGPPPMIEAAKDVFFAQNLSPDELFYDSFDYAADRQNP